jgi:hypothetical protein
VVFPRPSKRGEPFVRDGRGRAWLAAAGLVDARRCDALLYSSEVQPRVLADRRGRLRTESGSLCCPGADQAVSAGSSHRGGHWFDPSIAHPAHAGPRPASTSVALGLLFRVRFWEPRGSRSWRRAALPLASSASRTGRSSLSREGVEATLGLLPRFHEAGRPVWSLREPWTETADPHMAELLGAIYVWMARQESARRSERAWAGLDRRKAAGLPVGYRAGSKGRRQRKRPGYALGLPPLCGHRGSSPSSTCLPRTLTYSGEGSDVAGRVRPQT